MKTTLKNRKSFPLNLTSEILSQIERVAQKEGKTKTDILREAVNYYLEEKRWKEIREYGARQAAKLGIKEKDIERLREEYWEERKREIAGK
jgi:metal-responsive CopG/Arc/MetJ family transcriptional regulator